MFVSQSFQGVLQPQVAEAVAVLRGLRLALESGLYPALLESDALSVVKMINERVIPCADIGIVLHDILVELGNPCFISVSFVPRLANCVAHNLAKLALGSEGEFV
ncbi:hypothetical protein LWI29_023054 [Acer saccharum]|uniref:RNase H type-1 domain-containing protein n=1 Tax=Acer saccharum TaxID=4024 RepID=A0AA39T5F9_ACESA|nr:hypothetical protein LWI29_023054 [Acer saccharum]